MKYDAVIIGTGPGGYHAAIRLAQLGKKVLAVEKDEIGGLCLNRGCIPTKTLCHIVELKRKLKLFETAGIDLEIKSFDFKKMHAWKHRVVRKLVKGVELLLRKNGVEIIKGNAKIVEKNRVLINDKEIFGKNIIIASGTSPLSLPKIKRDGKYIFYGEEALFFEEPPKKMLVIGAGATGLEMATIYNELGSEVWVVEIMEQILPGIDRELTDYLERILLKQGIKIFTGSEVKNIKKKNKKLVVKIKNEKEEEIIVDRALLCVGRRPVLDFIKLPIEKDKKGFLNIDFQLKTSIETIYAIGDVTGPPLVAHKAMHQGIGVAEIITGKRKSYELKEVPFCVFTIPPLASIGVSEEEALKRGYKISIGRFPYAASGRASTLGEVEGMVKVIREEKNKTIIGVHILGEGAPLLIGEAIVALGNKLKGEELSELIHPHPTLLEILSEASANLDKKAIHILN